MADMMPADEAAERAAQTQEFESDPDRYLWMDGFALGFRTGLSAAKKANQPLLTWAARAALVIEDLEGPTRDWDYDESAFLLELPDALENLVTALREDRLDG